LRVAKRDAPGACLAAASACGGEDPQPCRWPAPSNASTPIPSSTTIFRAWGRRLSPRQTHEPQGLREGFAILAGDALLTQAVRDRGAMPCVRVTRTATLSEIARAAGSLQLIATSRRPRRRGKAHFRDQLNTFMSEKPRVGFVVPSGSAA